MSEQDLKNRLGALAAETREQLGISRVEFSKRAGVALATMQRFEIGESWPQKHTLAKIVTTLGWKSRIVDQLLVSGRDPSSITLDDVFESAGPARGRVRRAADLTDEELLTELTARMTQKQREIERLQAGAPRRDLFDLAAHADEEPRRLEFEAPDDRGEEAQS